MKNIRPSERYAAEIYDRLISGFDDENEEQTWDLNTVDATQWFTGLIKASGMLYNRLAQDDKNFIQFTHLCQELLIQDMMAKKEGQE